MFYLLISGLLFLSSLLQIQNFIAQGVSLKADLVLVLVVCLTLVRGLRGGLAWAFFGGLLLDFMLPPIIGGNSAVGLSALLLLVVAAGTSLGQNNFFETNLVMPLVITAFATFFYLMVLLLLTHASDLRSDPTNLLLRLVLPSVIINTLLAPLCYSLVLWLSNRFASRLPVEWEQQR